MPQQSPRQRPVLHEGNYSVGSAELHVPGSARLTPEFAPIEHAARDYRNFSQFDSGACVVIDKLLSEELFRTNILNPDKLEIFAEEQFDTRTVRITVLYKDRAFDDGILRACSEIPIHFLNEAMQTCGRMRAIAGALAEQLEKEVMKELGWEVTVAAEKPKSDHIRMIRL